jgi:hypothetical protein
MVVWTWVPLLIRSLLQTLNIALSGRVPSHLGLAAFVFALGQPLPQGTSRALLSVAQLDIFVLWNLMLLALGVLTITRLPRTKAFYVTAGYWAAATAASLVLTLVRQAVRSRFLGGGGPGV